MKSTIIQPNHKLKVTNDKGSLTYKVKKGDTLYKISKKHKVSVSNLKKWNKLTSTTIQPNQKLKVSMGKTKIPSRSTSSKVAKEFTVTATAYTANCNGCTGITKTGINLKRNPDTKIIAVDPKIIKLGTKVYVEGYGYAVAGDIGSAIKGNKIDVFFPKKTMPINPMGEKREKKILK